MIENLEARVEAEANQEWSNPTDNFGDRLALLVEAETGEILGENLANQINDWQDLFLSPFYDVEVFKEWAKKEVVEFLKLKWNE